MLHFGVPLSISAILGGFITQFYGFMMAVFCNDAVIGNYRIATNFAVVLAFFTFPISTVLFPAFSKVNPENVHKLLKTVFASSVKYTVLLLLPTTMIIMILAKPMVGILYGNSWTSAPLFLTLYVVGNFFAVFGSLSLGGFLMGLGETKMVMKLSIVTILFGLPLAFLLIPALGIIGVILGTITSGLPSMIWGLSWTWKHYKVKADFTSSAKIFVASAVAAGTTYLFLNFFEAAEWIVLIAGGIIFLAFYIFSAPLIGAITQSDINNLRTVFSGLGFISKLINIPLSLAERVASLPFVRGDEKIA
jgi:O-antigen/teichoic acid export membrane protein